ncbi:MAG: glycosyltransferase [Lachnospiraceae bacterium]|nr:glycosyltransferase [Lachnospiraceae bacterium]
MSQISRTISFLKRNGLIPTIYAASERLGWFGADPDQLRANAYSGSVQKDVLRTEDQIAEDLQKITTKYRFSIVVPAYETDPVFFREMVNSVRNQSYPYWQLVIADASKTGVVENAMDEMKDDRICFVRLEENKGISENTNAAVNYADGDYIGLLDHDDLLHPEALMEIALFMQGGEYDMVYTDEDKISGDSKERFEPNFKPDFNFDFLLSNNYICHFTVLSKKLMDRIAFRPAFNGAQDYDLFLQAIYEMEKQRREEYWESKTDLEKTGQTGAYIPYEKDAMRRRIGHVAKVLYHWRAHMGSTSDNPESKRYAYEAGKRALERFAEDNKWDVSVEHTRHLGFYEMVYHPDIFAVRKDVTAVCGKAVRGGRVVSGPVLDGKMLWHGMNARYSGYLHRAVVRMSVESADELCIRCRDGLTAAEVSEGRMVYLPDYIVRK